MVFLNTTSHAARPVSILMGAAIYQFFRTFLTGRTGQRQSCTWQGRMAMCHLSRQEMLDCTSAAFLIL